MANSTLKKKSYNPAIYLTAGFTRDAELRVGNIDENAVVLLLKGGDDVQNRVDADIGGSRHGKA